MNNSSYQTELDNFFEYLFDNLEETQTHVYKGSFSKARKKLKYEVFVELNDYSLPRSPLLAPKVSLGAFSS
jgi:hypothetical protein